jgi:hypothetical protein
MADGPEKSGSEVPDAVPESLLPGLLLLPQAARTSIAAPAQTVAIENDFLISVDASPA